MLRLPPLNAFRAFEAAGRHGNFAGAAAELNVTPSAISRQIKNLEEYLGMALFARRRQRVFLTEAGRRYLEFASTSLANIESETEHLLRLGGSEPLRISSPRLFTSRWLLPHLKGFQKRHPAQLVIVNFARSDETLDSSTDIAIRLGNGKWPDVEAHRLFDLVLVPVCSPDYLKIVGPIRKPADLLRTLLLSTHSRRDDWATWLKATKVSANAARRLSFQETGLAYQAAIEGMGFAIGRRRLIDADLAAGHLVAPLGIDVPTGEAVYVTHRPWARPPARVVNFRRWILQETTLGPAAARS